MCGICGVVSADPRPVEPAVRAMMRAMVHRGPDDEGFELLPLGHSEAEGPVAGFGFRRLSILDLSAAGHQPIFNHNTGDCLIFNGEIYNFRQLRTELQLAGVVFRSTSDTEALLQALSTWGEAAVEKLQGMFAFAFYHASSQRILLGRDPLGIKPLYVAALEGRFLFSSEIRPLLATGLVPKDLDLAGIAGMLAYGAVQSPRTVYEHIRSFPAGHTQWIESGIIAGRSPAAPRRYWSFPQEGLKNDRRQAANAVHELLRDSVLRHLVADVPVGVFLSAGIDSTIIASFAREYTPKVTAFTVGFGPVHGEDEVSHAKDTARTLGIKHVAVQLDAANMPEKWHDWLEGMDSPSVDGFNTYVVSRRLAAEGVVVGLSGLGADELFGGYSTFRRAIWGASILRPLTFIPPGLWRKAARILASVLGSTSRSEKLRDLLVENKSAAGITRSLRRILPDSRIEALYSRVNQQESAVSSAHIISDGVAFPNCHDAFNAVSRAEVVHYMGDTLLRDTDANSMRHSLEVRVPFLDLPLVNYVSSLQGRRKYGGVCKSLLRKACAETLPPHVAKRSKTGFTLPIGQWMRREMRDSCEAALANLTKQTPLDAVAINELWQLFLARPEETGWLRPMTLVSLGAYLK